MAKRQIYNFSRKCHLCCHMRNKRKSDIENICHMAANSVSIANYSLLLIISPWIAMGKCFWKCLYYISTYLSKNKGSRRFNRCSTVSVWFLCPQNMLKSWRDFLIIRSSQNTLLAKVRDVGVKGLFSYMNIILTFDKCDNKHVPEGTSQRYILLEKHSML